MRHRIEPGAQQDAKSSAPAGRSPEPPFGLRPDTRPPSAARFGPAAALVAVLVVVALALLVLPQVLRLSRASHPTWIADLAGQGSGAYLSASGGYYKLRPLPELPSFPRTSATVAPTVTVVTRGRGPVRPDHFKIVAYRSRAAVAVSVLRLGGSTLELRPAHSLAPGRYFVQMPADATSGDQAFFYFQVAASSPSPSPSPAPSESVTPTPTPGESVTPSPAPGESVTPTPTPSESVTPTSTPSDTAAPAAPNPAP